MTSVQDDFKAASQFVGTPQKGFSPTTEEKLLFYGLYKQANSGDNTEAQPGILSIEARKKWNAWEAVKGTTKEDAMKKYIQELEKRSPSWRG